MVGTKVVAAESLPQTVYCYDRAADCPLNMHFCAGHFAIIDDLEWPGLEAVRAGLIRERRAFKSPFHPPIMPTEVMRGYNAMVKAADALVHQMLPERREEALASFRPMITGPEPMHFDSYDAPVSTLTAFINVATTPRIYRIGPTFEHLATTQPKVMKHLASEKKVHGLSYSIRQLTVANQPPLPASSDAHDVAFAPGAIWFFNGKTASHEVVHGEGAVGISWALPDSLAPTQEALLKRLQ